MINHAANRTLGRSRAVESRRYEPRKLSITKICKVVFLSSLIAACDPKPANDAQPTVARPIKIWTLGEHLNEAVVELPGTVQAARESDVAFEVPGRIIEINVDEGEKVEIGDILAKLDPRDYAAALDKAQAQRNTAFADYQRYLKAVKKNAVTRQTVDVARGQFEASEADLNRALKALEDSVLRAPFAGRIARKMASEFANVQAKQPVFRIHDESALEVKVNIAERDWAKANPNMTPSAMTTVIKPKVVVSALPDRVFPAKAKSFSTLADPVTRTSEATFSFYPPDDAVVTSGMTAKVIIDVANMALLEQKDVLSIPPETIIADAEGRPYVWLINDNDEVSLQAVVTGPLVSGRVTIEKGLKNGDRIALSGVHTLKVGMRVKPLISNKF